MTQRPGLVRWSVDKRYLKDLDAHGMAIVPTIWVSAADGDEMPNLDALIAAQGWAGGSGGEAAISATAHQTWRVGRTRWAPIGALRGVAPSSPRWRDGAALSAGDRGRRVVARLSGGRIQSRGAEAPGRWRLLRAARFWRDYGDAIPRLLWWMTRARRFARPQMLRTRRSKTSCTPASMASCGLMFCHGARAHRADALLSTCARGRARMAELIVSR